MASLSEVQPARILHYLLTAPSRPFAQVPADDEGWEPFDTEPPPLPRRRRRSVALLAAAALLLAGGLAVDAEEVREATASMEAGRSPEGGATSEEIDEASTGSRRRTTPAAGPAGSRRIVLNRTPGRRLMHEEWEAPRMDTARLLDLLLTDPSPSLALESGDEGWETLG